MIRVETDKKNANGKIIGYDLMPIRMGSARHNEEFTRHDFWVSQSHPETSPRIHLLQPAQHREGRGTGRIDRHRALGHLVVAPRAPQRGRQAQLGAPASGPATTPGKARRPVMWSGFDLRPRNFFDRTPFYPYAPAPPPGATRPPAGSRGAGRGN